ncbi:MAG: hypothetical protein Alpg2KO_02710 [Alphaproteobacteria bacterium]
MKQTVFEAKVIAGGPTRRKSVHLALKALQTMGELRRPVVIHDAARPAFDPQDLANLLAALQDTHGAIIARPITDTIKQLHPEDSGKVGQSIDRSMLVAAQTPQAFDADILLNCHDSLPMDQPFTDDASLLEAMGLDVSVVMGSVPNTKITWPGDLKVAEQELQSIHGTEDSPPAPGLPDIRMATGFDVHAFEDGDHVILCGIKLPHDKKLKGHSDADVGLHALTDAILGCCAAGDIGQHFPPSEPQWKGAESGQFLTHAVNLLKQAGGVLRHVDVTLICERPKIGPHLLPMRTRVAELTGLDLDRVSIKATTTEQLGFTGRKEGIAAQAAASAVFI